MYATLGHDAPPRSARVGMDDEARYKMTDSGLALDAVSGVNGSYNQLDSHG